MNKILCLLIACWSIIITHAQQPAPTGIKWTTGLSWEQVKEKAKREKKYIFLDVFATWCGPCKAMDKEVYPDDTLGTYFNDRFISIRVQTDQTPKDNEFVKLWYDDAAAVVKQYRINSFPSLVFLSPEGETVQFEVGYKNSRELINIVTSATQPGKVYTDRYAEYDKLLQDYRKGIKNYDRMAYMIQTAAIFDTILARKLLVEYTDFKSKQDVETRYTKSYIEFLNALGLSTESKSFQYFLKNGDFIDKVMHEAGYSTRVVQQTILNEVALPFLQARTTKDLHGMYVGGPGVKSDSSEADWKQLKRILRKDYTKTITERVLIAARLEWYERLFNTKSWVKYKLIQLEKYPPNLALFKGIGEANVLGWTAFLHSNNIKDLKACINWIEKLAVSSGVAGKRSDWMDTYANLLYKVGRINEAIMWQQRAVDMNDKNVAGYRVQLERMKKNEPTYIEMCANWEGINWIDWRDFVFKKSFVITDTARKVIPEVSIFSKRSNKSFATKENGFAAPEVSVGDILTISYPGYESQEITIGKDASMVTIILQPQKTK